MYVSVGECVYVSVYEGVYMSVYMSVLMCMYVYVHTTDSRPFSVLFCLATTLINSICVFDFSCVISVTSIDISPSFS